jgi:hypothetical protein
MSLDIPFYRTTYKSAGTAKISGSRTRHPILWVGLWVGNFAGREFWGTLLCVGSDLQDPTRQNGKQFLARIMLPKNIDCGSL